MAKKLLFIILGAGERYALMEEPDIMYQRIEDVNQIMHEQHVKGFVGYSWVINFLRYGYGCDMDSINDDRQGVLYRPRVYLHKPSGHISVHAEYFTKGIKFRKKEG